MIVVGNTSPLTNLAAVGQFDLLRHLYGHLHIAQGVWEELNAGGKRWPGRDEVAGAEWIEHHAIQNRTLITALQRDLDRGEAETIALALEIEAIRHGRELLHHLAAGGGWSAACFNLLPAAARS
jgi:predicted nucleic acid-binding protein